MASSTSELESGSLNTSLQSTTGSLHTVEQDEAAAVSYMQQLTSLLSTDDDIQVIRATHALRQDIARAQARTQATAKQAISALQKTVDREAEAIATTSDKAQWERALASAQAEKRRLLAELQRARAGHDTTRAAIDDIRRQIGATRTAIERIGTDSAAQIPRVRHMLSLYTNITSLTWDFKSPDIAGSPVVFSYRQGEKSEFELANALWRHIAESTADA